MQKRILIVMAIVLIVITGVYFCYSSCGTLDYTNTLRSLAYNDDMEEIEYTVMIREQGEYVPYLVLTDNYSGNRNCLLLRKYLLEDYYRYNEAMICSSYYGTCELGLYLNEVFVKNYSNELRELIVDSRVQITTYDGIFSHESSTEVINRKVFLLSYEELGYVRNDISPKEGQQLKFFYSSERRIALNESGEKGKWWLRTPYLKYDTALNAVSARGLAFPCGVTGPGFDYELGVRPAFCLPRDTTIIEVDGVDYIEADYNALDVMHNAEDRTAMLYEDVPTTNLVDAVEKVPDEHRPEGYHVNVRNALAFKMEEHKEDVEYKYHVMMYSVYEIDLAEILFEINSDVNNNLFFDMGYWRYMECTDGMEKYYYALTAAEINELVQHKIICAYVGSGEGSLEKANWDTTEGILEYCEIYGDGYVAE